jgi:hypothetical protein
LAWCNAVVVLPTARGPRSTTAPIVCNFRAIKESSNLGLYAFMRPEYHIVFDFATLTISVLKRMRFAFCNEYGLCFATRQDAKNEEHK